MILEAKRSITSMRALIASLSASGAIQALNVLTGVLLARELGPELRGELATVILWPTLIALVGSLGLPEAVTFYSARCAIPTRAIVSTALAGALALSLALTAMGAVVIPFVLSSHDSAVVGVATFYLLFVPLNILTLTTMNILNGIDRSSLFHFLRFFAILGQATGILALALLSELSIRNAAIVYLASNLSTLLIALAFLIPTCGLELRFRPALAKELFRFGIGSHGGNVSVFLNERLDQLAISAFLAPARLGIYVVAVTMTSVLSLIGTSIGLVILPIMSRVQEKTEQVAVFRRYCAITIGLGAICAIPLFAFMPQLISLFFGEDFADASLLARILLPAGLMLAMGKVAMAALRGMGRPSATSSAGLVGVIMTIGGMAVLLPTSGLVGAAVASLLAYTASAWWALNAIASGCDISIRQLVLPSRASVQSSPPSVVNSPVVQKESSRTRYQPSLTALNWMPSLPAQWLSAGLLGAALSLVIGLLVVLAEPSLNIALIGALAIVLLLPLVVRIIRGRFDLFDPFTVAAIALFVMFVLRPAALLIDGQTFYNGYSIEATFKEALFVALLGCVAFVVGYQTPIGSRLAGRLGPIAPRGLQIGSVAIYAIGIFCLGVSLYALFILQSGGINALASFLVGRLPEHNDLFISSTGYLYQGLLLSVPASLLLFATGTIQGTTRLQVVGLLLMIPLLVLASTTGGRLQLLTLVSGPIVFLYLYRQRRPQALKVIFLLLIALPVLLGALRDARVAEQREQNRGEVLQEAVLHPDRQWGELILGADTEMFDTLATELSVVPEYLSFQHGAVFSDVGVRAVPRPIWPNKPLESNDLMIDTLWPEHYSQSRASSASSIIGSLYLDSGPLSVAVGMALLGVVVKILATWAATWRTDAAAQMVAALSIPLLVVLLRGTLPHTLSILAFTMVPLIVGLLFTRIGAEKPSPAESALTYRPGWRAS